MSPEHQIALEIGSDRFSIYCDDAAVVGMLRTELSPWLIDSMAFPGFKIEMPTSENRMWVLLASDATILARNSDVTAVVRSLKRHLGSLAGTRSIGAFSRTSLRTIVGGRSVAVLEKALLQKQPFSERQYQRFGLAVLDAPFADLAAETPTRLLGLDVPPAFVLPGEPGHAPADADSRPVSCLMWPGTEGANRPTHAQMTHALASVTMNGTHKERLSRAKDIASAMPIRFVSMDDRNGVLRIAREMLNA